MSYLSASRPKRVALVIAGVAMIAIGDGGVGVTSTTRNTGRRSGPLDMSNLVVGVDGVKLSLTTKAQTLTLITPTGNQVIPLRSGSANMRQQLELLGMMAGDKLTVTKKRNGKGPTTTWFGNFDRLDDTNVYIWTDRAHSEVHHMHIAFDDILSIHLERTADARAAEAFFLGTEHDGAAAASPASFTPKSRMHDKYDADTLLLHTKHD